MQEFGFIKSLPENILLFEGQSFWAFPRAECLISDLHPELVSGHVSSLQWSWCNLCRGSWQVPTFSQQGPFTATYLAVLWGHFMAICVPWCWEGTFPGLGKIPLKGPLCVPITGPGLASSKSLCTIPVPPDSWSRKIFPLVASSLI